MTGFNPSILKDLTRAQIAADLNHPRRNVAQVIDGSANQLTAAICLVTQDKPWTVCNTKLIAKIQRSLRPEKRD